MCSPSATGKDWRTVNRCDYMCLGQGDLGAACDRHDVPARRGCSTSATIPAAATTWLASSEFAVSINRCTEGSSCDIEGFGQPLIGTTQVGGDGDQQMIPVPWILDPQDAANVIVGTCRVWRGPGTRGSGWSSANLLSPMLDGDPGPYCNGNTEIRSVAASGSATLLAWLPVEPHRPKLTLTVD